MNLYIQAWETQLRITPYFVKKAEGFNEEQLASIIDLNYENHLELQAIACVCFTCVTAIRVEDLHQAKTTDLTCTPPSNKNPRNFKLKLPTTKNDSDGTGSVENRTWIVPCYCLEDLEKAAKQKLARQLSANALVSCVAACPQNVLTMFLRECPPPNVKYPNPSLFRALTSKGEVRTLTCNPLGIHSIRELTKLVNERLPV